MTIMAQKLDMKRINWSSKKEKEVIHSGHFMVSDFEAEAQDDEDELAVPVPDESEIKTGSSASVKTVQKNVSVAINSVKISGSPLAIDTSLTKLFRCMSLAYRQKLTSPKWNRFKGIRLRWKDKIRLNNVIWRCWHMQFINKQNTLVCQFASPLDVDTHSKPEAVVLEGKYWKRKLNAVTAEYKKWRMFHHNQLLGRPEKYGHDLLTEYDSQDWQLNSADSMMMVDEDYMGLMSDTLFSTITANQPYAFPDTREIARSANLADFIQPSLVQLQPNLEEFMDIEPLHDFICNRLTTVPEEPVLQPQLAGAANYPDAAKSQTINQSPPTYQPQYQSQYQQNMWYIVPPFTEPFQETQQSIVPIQQQMAQISQEDSYLKDKSTALGTNGNKKMALTGPVIKKVNQPSVQRTMQENQPGNALLAQLLTNNTSYNFMGNEPVKKEEIYMQQFSDLYKKNDYSQDSQITPPLMKQPSLTNIGGSICPESPKNEPQSLSPLGSVGSPTSPSGKPYKEHRRVCHINAEQKRRCNIKNGFDMLHSLIPQLNQNPNAKMSKAAMLQKGAEYIRQLQGERNQLKQEMESLKKQIETLNSDICNCQSLLPATGAPISKHRSNKMKDMYRKYVRTRVHDNWKFWILSLICEPLLESFNNNIATSSLDDLYRTTLQWIDQHCTLVDLRPIVLNALRQLCTMTEVLTEPLRLPIEARAAVDKKKS